MNTASHLESIIGHLGAAKMQRAPSDDRIIAEHIEAALDVATAARRSPDPLLALAYWVEATADRRIEGDVCAMSLLTDMRDRARKAIERATGVTENALYPVGSR